MLRTGKGWVNRLAQWRCPYVLMVRRRFDTWLLLAVLDVRRSIARDWIGCGHRQFGQPEVQYLALAMRRHKDVARLKVAVNDAATLGGIERIGNLDTIGENLLYAQTFPRKPRRRVSPSRYSITK